MHYLSEQIITVRLLEISLRRLYIYYFLFTITIAVGSLIQQIRRDIFEQLYRRLLRPGFHRRNIQ